MLSITDNVTKVIELNECLTRIITEEENSIDIPTKFANVSVGDAIKVSIENDRKADCVFNGHVYSNVGDYSFVSCGGLLSKLRINLKVGEDIIISFTKSRRRKRKVATT